MYYSFYNNGLEYEEIKKLLSVKPEKELIECVITKGIIKQEEAVDYEEIKHFELVNDEKVEYCTITEDQKVESYELIEEKCVKIIESCELIENKEDNDQLIEDKRVENDVHKLIKEIIEPCESIEDQEDINKLNEYLEIIFNKTFEITFNESPFKSLISDIRSILLKDGCRELKKRLKHIRELRKSTTLEIKNIKNELIKKKIKG